MYKDECKNLFQIMDEMLYQLNNTKRLFMAMILTVMIISPLVLLLSLNYQSLIPSSFSYSTLHLIKFSHYKDEHRENYFRNDVLLYTITRNVTLIIGLLWFGIEIRQWIILSKWNKKY